MRKNFKDYLELAGLKPTYSTYFSLQCFEKMKFGDEACSSQISDEQRIYNLLAG